MKGFFKLFFKVKSAVDKLSISGIEGWGLGIPEELKEFFEVVVVGGSVGCISDTCRHESHDPAACICKLIPKQGELVKIGEEVFDTGTDEWVVLILPNDVKFFLVRHSRASWSEIMEQDWVPEYMLARMVE